MALAIDGSSPAVVRNALTTTTTASFSPPAQTALVAFVQADENSGSTDEACTVSSTGGLSWALAVRSNGTPGATVEVWWAWAATAPGSITVSCTDNKGAKDKSLLVRVFTGADSAVIGATNSASTGLSTSYTSTGANSWGWGATLSAGTSPAAGTGQTFEDSITNHSFDGGDDIATLKQNSTTATVGTSVTMSITGPTNVSHIVAVEILAAAATSVPWTSPRGVVLRDSGEVQWLQSDRRDANRVATAADPVPSPLDTAWQADAAYWHQYADSALWSRRLVPQQRPYVSDPLLLTTAELEGALLGGWDDRQRRYEQAALDTDRREVPQQRPYVSDPLLLTTAELEGALLGSFDDLHRRRMPAEMVDRRLVPRQRTYLSVPGMLATAELENELLGGADLARHYLAAAYTDRREVPQQRLYDSDPLLLTTAELENELLGSFDDLHRRRIPAETIDRREVPQQRLYISNPALLTTALLENELLGSFDDLHRRRVPAETVERREVPQQRAYVSDPLLLTTAELENELLGGADLARDYLAAAYTDRREMPQQRLYVSDPLLLTTAELENELLGSFDDLHRRRIPAEMVDRREVPQQRLYVSDPLLLTTAQLENELLGGADDLRRRTLEAATHADRRQAGSQPAHSTLYFDAGPDVPPLTVAYGAGGAYWAVYNEHAWQPDRREVPQQRLYISDPSFYPTVAPIDPLTVAYGAGGTFWQLYNAAALYVDRRLAPQQRLRASVPGMLDTALLEDALLGIADAARHYLAAAYTDRREVPQQRAYVSDPGLLLTALLENELLGGADDRQRRYQVTRQSFPLLAPRALPAPDGLSADPLFLLGDMIRRNLPATHVDRRETAWQPPRQTVYFDAGPGQAPLTLAAGAGGSLWHLYNDAALRRTAIRTWQLIAQLAVGMPPRDLALLADSPRIGWRASGPYAGWDADTPVTSWRATPPNAQ